jgi:hypothetical protein
MLVVSEDEILNVVERSFRIAGPEGLGSRPRPELIGPVLSGIEGTLLDAVRMGFLHSSRARGRVSASLRAAADARFLGHTGEDGATLLHFDIPTFGSVAAEFFQQRLLWDDGPKPEETAFELFGAALHDVAVRRTDSSSFDPGLLRRIRTYQRVLTRGVDRITMPDTLVERRGQIDAEVVIAASELYAVTPTPRRVRVTGRLDVMGASQGVLKLEVKSGEFVTALWEGDAPVESLREFFNRDVVIEGIGVFRPSGSLLRIDADAIAPATSQDEFFRSIPTGTVQRDYHQLARLKPGEKSVYAQLRGSLAGDDSDEEFEAALAALR